MKKLFLFSLILTSSLLHAETFTDRIHSIDEGIIKFDNGRVAFLDQRHFELRAGDYLQVKVDKRNSLVAFKMAPSPQAKNLKQFSSAFSPTRPPFEPTLVQGMEEALKIFHRSNPYWKRVSECSDRAHVWAHDEFKLSGTKSRKAFIFLTPSYINRVRFKWWYHVAPLYRVNDNGVVKELVMDYRYSDRPQTVKEWTDLLVYSKRSCKVTTRFSDYDMNAQKEDCILIYESMHYKLPLDIHQQELSGLYKTATSESEIATSFRNAFEK